MEETMTEETQTTKPNVVRTQNVCSGGVCPLCTPFGLATFLVGFMVAFYAPWPYQALGILTVCLGYLNGFIQVIRAKIAL
jgi:hypothetical protein